MRAIFSRRSLTAGKITVELEINAKSERVRNSNLTQAAVFQAKTSLLKQKKKSQFSVGAQAVCPLRPQIE